MSRTLNKVQLIGRLGADPQMKYTTSGVPVTTFSVATNRQWSDKEGNLREETDWHNIVAWDKLAQTCAEYLTKGRLVYIEGRLQTRSWEFEGRTQYKTEIIAYDMLMLDTKSTPTGELEQEQPAPIQEPVAIRPSSRQSAAPVAASAGAARPSRPSRTATLEAEEDPEDLPF
jgi:single-strand DNA-binding protein